MEQQEEQILEEIKAVRETAMYYVKGTIDRNYEYLCKGWHPECKMMGLNPEKELVLSPRSFWEEAFKTPINDPLYKRTSEIINIDITGNAASVKVKTLITSSNPTIIFTDYLNLLKIQGQWQIVNKIYNMEQVAQNKE